MDARIAPTGRINFSNIDDTGSRRQRICAHARVRHIDSGERRARHRVVLGAVELAAGNAPARAVNGVACYHSGRCGRLLVAVLLYLRHTPHLSPLSVPSESHHRRHLDGLHQLDDKSTHLRMGQYELQEVYP